MVASISHIALIVRDPARTAELFAGVLGARIVPQRSDDDGHPQSFANFGGMWFVLRQGDGPSVRNGDHISLCVTQAELAACADKLITFDVEHYMARQDTALYFTDYDNHVFELSAAVSMGDMLAEATPATYTLRA
jgi:catechol 2,3-dioxygenase-like lactoylglutathione lyase family enzyme